MNRDEIIKRLRLWNGLGPEDPVDERMVDAIETAIKFDADDLTDFISNLRAFVCVECGRTLALGESCHCWNDE